MELAEIGLVLKAEMKSQQITHAQMAERLCVSQSSVTMALNNSNIRPMPDLLMRIADELGFVVNKLITYELTKRESI